MSTFGGNPQLPVGIMVASALGLPVAGPWLPNWPGAPKKVALSLGRAPCARARCNGRGFVIRAL